MIGTFLACIVAVVIVYAYVGRKTSTFRLIERLLHKSDVNGFGVEFRARLDALFDTSQENGRPLDYPFLTLQIQAEYRRAEATRDWRLLRLELPAVYSKEAFGNGK